MSNIVPTGSPAWTRNADHTVYGGDLNKTNWHTQGATNSRTDVTAEALCRLAEDVAAAVRTAPFCELTVVVNDSDHAVTVNAVNQMTGVRVTSYDGASPPAGFPSATRNGTGDFTILWDTSYTDDYGVSGDVNVQHVVLQTHGTVALIPVAELQDPNVDGFNEAVRVRVFTTAGSAASSPTVTISVCTGTA